MDSAVIIVTPLIATFMGIIFFLSVLIFLVFTYAVAYHWFSYGTNYKTFLTALAVYLCGSAPLLLIMSLALRAL